jgi:hypothetical protein
MAARAHDEEAKRLWTRPILNFLPDGSLNPHSKQRIAAHSLIQRGRQQRARSRPIVEEEEEEEEEEQNEEEESGGGGKQRASSFRGA